MKTGGPSWGSLPKWKQYTQEGGETMILNELSEFQT